MRQALAIFALIAMYGIIAYSIGIPLPSPLWRWFFALVALEFVLLYHEQRVIDHLVGPVTKPGYTAEQDALLKRIENGKMERMFVLLVAFGSAFSMTALFCCHDSVWSGPQDGAQIFGLILVGGFHICLFMAAAIGCTEGIQKSEKALAESLSPSAPVEAGTVESGAVEPDLEAGLDSKK